MSFQIKERNILQKQIKRLKQAGLFKNYQQILGELEKDPKSRGHHFELLERRRSGPSIYSKRVSQSNRVVYSIVEELYSEEDDSDNLREFYTDNGF